MTHTVFSVIHEHDDFIVVDKHMPMEFHCNRDGVGLHEHLKQTLGLSELFPVHRLDKETTGLLLFAKHKHSAVALNALFTQRKIDKYYIALSASQPKKKQGTIKGDMAASRRGNYKLLPTCESPAVTQFKSASVDVAYTKNVCDARSDFLKIFLLKPKTGKTHQLRVALKSISAPVLGDARYAVGQEQQSDRMYLHAYQLLFDWKGERCVFTSHPNLGTWFMHNAVERYIRTHWGSPNDLNWPKN